MNSDGLWVCCDTEIKTNQAVTAIFSPYDILNNNNNNNNDFISVALFHVRHAQSH